MGRRRKKINIKTNFRKLNKNTTKRNRKIALHFYIVVCCKTSLLRPNWLNDYPEWLSVCLMYYLLESDEQKMENGIVASHISAPSHWIFYVCVWSPCEPSVRVHFLRLYKLSNNNGYNQQYYEGKRIGSNKTTVGTSVSA